MTTPTAVYTGPTAAELACIPEALKARPQWVLWRGVDKVDEDTGEIKLNKVPYTTRRSTKAGRATFESKASSTNKKTWGTFAAVVAALPPALAAWEHEAPADYRGGGIGFVFSPDDPFCGIDLDKCRNPETGELAPWAAAIIAQVDSYSETSPTGTGAHILAEGILPPGDRKKDRVEMYTEGRFFTITGQHLPMTPTTIEARQAAITAVHTAHVARPKDPPPPPRRPTAALDLDDMAILVKAKAAQNSAKFADLWAGDTSRYGGDDSSADQALCDLLAFWTRDASQIDRLFRGSGLYRDKWDEARGKQTYGERTIAQALTKITTTYDPDAWLDAQIAATKGRDGQGHTSTPGAAPLQDETPPAEEPWTLQAFLVMLEALDSAERPQAVVEAMKPLSALSTTQWMLAKGAIKKLVPEVNLNDLRTARKELLLAAKLQARAEAFQTLPEWQQALFYADGDQLQETDNNLQAIFANHPDWHERFSWDVVANRVYIDEEQSLDIDYVRNEVTPWLGRVMRMPVRHSSRVLDVMRSWAHHFPYDPIQEWLTGLPETDPADLQRDLLDTWLIRYAGAEDTPYTRFISRLLIVSMVQRGMLPGCQYRYVVVLEGEEDLGKTKLLRVLGDRWHQEFPKTVEGKEAYMQLQGYWLVELGELDALKPAQETRIKMFISQQMDVWVPKYENDAIERPRRAILVGTTNEREYLKGEHGNTRYLPIFLPGPIQHDAVAKVRHRLFTQAKHFLADHPEDWWCIPAEAAEQVTWARKMRKEPSVFEEPVRKLVHGQQECTVAELLERLSIPKDRWTKRLEMEIGAALTDVGWYRHVEWDPPTKKMRRSWKSYPQQRSVCLHEHVNDAGVCNDCSQQA
jgi:putative DNA primase/helicase